MNARHLFRYARYALAALASVGFGLLAVTECRTWPRRGRRSTEATEPIQTQRLLNQPVSLFQEVKP